MTTPYTHSGTANAYGLSPQNGGFFKVGEAFVGDGSKLVSFATRIDVPVAATGNFFWELYNAVNTPGVDAIPTGAAIESHSGDIQNTFTPILGVGMSDWTFNFDGSSTLVNTQGYVVVLSWGDENFTFNNIGVEAGGTAVANANAEADDTAQLNHNLYGTVVGSGGPPTITVQPQDVHKREGQTATFSVAATSSAPNAISSFLTQQFNGLATSHNVTMPASVAAGDLLLVAFVNQGGTVTTPSGWTLLSSVAAAAFKLGVYAKKAAGTEGGTTVDFATSTTCFAASHLYQIGVSRWTDSGTLTSDVVISTVASGIDGNANAASLTPGWSAQDTLWLAIYGADNASTTPTGPANYTNVTATKVNTGASDSGVGSARRRLSAATEDSGAFTGAGVNWKAYEIAIRVHDITYQWQKVIDPLWASVKLLALNENGADAATAFSDKSDSQRALTTNGNAQWDTAQAPTGLTSSLLGDGTGDFLTALDSADWAFGTGDYTVEGFVRFNTVKNTAFLDNELDGTTRAWTFVLEGGSLKMREGGTVFTFGAWAASTGIWYHIASCRKSGVTRAFVAGTQLGAGQVGVSVPDIASTLKLGGLDWAAGYDLDGWMAGWRITKGEARYTANFTPPALPFPMWTDIASANSSSYTTPTLAASDNITRFRCVLVDVNGTTTSNAAVLGVDADARGHKGVFDPALSPKAWF